MLTRKQISLVTRHLLQKLTSETGNHYLIIYNYDVSTAKHAFIADCILSLRSVPITTGDQRVISLTDEEIAYILL